MLLPGERIVVRVRPTLASDPWTHIGAVALGLWAGVLAALYASGGWNQAVVWYEPWTWFVGNDVAAYLWLASAPILVGGACLALLRRRGAFLASAACVVAAAVVALASRLPSARAVPLGSIVAALGLLVFADLRRRSRALTITNLRILATQGLPRRPELGVRHAELVALDVRRRRLLPSSGDLVAVENSGAIVRFAGIPRVAQVRDAAQAILRQSTATPYLREAQGLDRQVADAVAALQRH